MISYNWIVEAFTNLHFMWFFSGLILFLFVVLNVSSERENDKLSRRNMELERELKLEKSKNKLLSEDNQRLSDECWEIYERYADVVEMCSDLRVMLGKKMIKKKKGKSNPPETLVD